MNFAVKNLWILTFLIGFLNVNIAHAACTNPTGVEGEIIYNNTHNVPQYCDSTNWIAMTSGMVDYIPNAVDFDGVSDYLDNGSTLSNSKQLTTSFWLKYKGGSTYFFSTQAPGVSGVSMRRVNSNSSIAFIGANASNTNIVSLNSNSDTVLDDDWMHVLISIDLTDPAKRHLYINDVDELASAPTYTDDTLKIDAAAIIGALNNSSLANVELADFWMESGTYVDLSIEANRRKFVDVSGNPVYLGANGELPTGSSPDIFLSGDTDDWHTNKGTGGGFTENGALTTATTTPYTPITEIVPSGLVGHWRLDETSGTTAFDSSGNGNDGTLVGSLGALDFGSDSVDGVIGSALYTEPAGSPAQHIEIIGGTGFPTGVAPETSISFWLKPYSDPASSGNKNIGAVPDN